MKKTVFAFSAIIISFAIIGCSKKADEPAQFRLVDLKNPFIGQWQSNIPSMDNAKAVFDFKADGTFTCLFPDLPPEYGGGVTYSGGYLVYGNIQVTFLSGDGGIGAYTFEAIDNDTISVTEINEVKEDGTVVSGNTTPFTRVAGSRVSTEDVPFVLSNTLIGGTWKETATSYQAEYQYNVDGSGTLNYKAGEQTASTKIAYFAVYDEGLEKNVLVTFIPGMNTFTPYSFAANSEEDTITASEITAVTMGGQGPSAVYGEEVIFTRSR